MRHMVATSMHSGTYGPVAKNPRAGEMSEVRIDANGSPVSNSGFGGYHKVLKRKAAADGRFQEAFPNGDSKRNLLRCCIAGQFPKDYCNETTCADLHRRRRHPGK